MQTSLRRGITLAAPFLLILFFLGCDTKKQDEHVRRIDSLTSILSTVQQELSTIKAAALVYHAPPGKFKKINVPNKPGRTRLSICVKPDFKDNDIDSVLVTVNVVKGSDQVTFAELKFGKKWPITQASLRWLEKGAHDIVLVTTWYKSDGSTHLGTWCEAPACTISPSAKCTDLNTNVSTAQSNSSGSSTTTVSVDEQ